MAENEIPKNGAYVEKEEDTTTDLATQIENQQDQTVSESQQQTISTLADQLGQQQQQVATAQPVVVGTEAKETPNYMMYIVIGIIIYLFFRS